MRRKHLAKNNFSPCMLVLTILVFTTIGLSTLWLFRNDGFHVMQQKLPTRTTTATKIFSGQDTKNISIATAIKISIPEPSTSPVFAKSCPSLIQLDPSKVVYPTNKKANGSFDFHFIHIPKCGGTSMTAILRQISCNIDSSRNADCCRNPGFCDWHAFQRCSAIVGCINHFPQRKWIFKPIPSVTILREPTSRLLSAWFYRGHSPNLDFFQVRPEFKEIAAGTRPRVTFEEYIEMPEYQNIQTRMLGADSFPYKNISVTNEVMCLAVEALNNIYFVGIQEVYDLSVQLLLRELHMNMEVAIHNERDNNNKKITEQKAQIRSNATLMNRLREVNWIDTQLYNLGVQKFCATINKYPDLAAQLKGTKITC